MSGAFRSAVMSGPLPLKGRSFRSGARQSLPYPFQKAFAPARRAARDGYEKGLTYTVGRRNATRRV